MWTLFSHRDHRHKHRLHTHRGQNPHAGSPPWAVTGANDIATIDRIGPTAVATVTVTELASAAGVARLMGLFAEVSQSGARHFVLDIQNLEYMDSACLGCLVKALNHAQEDGGGIALVNSESGVQDLFRLTRLDRRFPICHSVPAALATVERGR